MQSAIVYGRLFMRALAGLSNELQQSLSITAVGSSAAQEHLVSPSQILRSNSLHLISASSGFSKSLSSSQITKRWSFGDDACFISSHKQADVIGVADGVGGWRTYGIDPSQFSQSLMATCERLVREGHFSPQSPTGILVTGYRELLENKIPLLGSCTACLVSLHKDEKKLYTANLGDSGFLLIRQGAVVHRSECQQHYFNSPFQLSVAPDTLQGLVLSDSPESALSTSFGVEEGDVLLVGTDGLFDNLRDDMILRHISKLKDYKLESIQTIADSIARQARKLALDPEYMSPFALNAVQNGFNIKGGKPDDITVVLARVMAEDATLFL